MEPSIPVSISIANERRILLGPIILREKSPVRARKELERRNRKKSKQWREKKEGEKGVEGCRGRGHEKSGKREIVDVGYSPRMPSWLLLFLDLRTDAPRMSCSPLLYGPAWGPHSMPRPITYEMRRSYCKSLSLFLFLSFSRSLPLLCGTEPHCSNLSLYFRWNLSIRSW